jgi:predicted TIM-barrel fold metal-dependent hydrolase
MKILKQTFNAPSYLVVLFVIVISACSCRQNNYNMDDYSKISKIDAHVHDNSESSAFVDIAKQDGFKILSINVDYPDFPPLEVQQNIAGLHAKNYSDNFAFASTFKMEGWDDPDWLEKTISHLDSTFKNGAIAVKFWKNIGMVCKDKNGKLIMLDDKKFDPVFAYLKQQKIPVISHCGEPRDCWLAVDKMMSNDMKEYFSNHPQYHMYLQPDMPSYEDQMNARNRMLDKNPDLKVMGAHLGSMEWSVDEIIKFLHKYPNAVVDLAARMDYMQLQSQKDWTKVHNFFCDFKDRIVYGTDLIINPTDDQKVFKEVAHDKWLSDWKYLATNSEMTLPNIKGSFKGLVLPKEVIDKVYHANAERIFSKAWKSENN